MTNNITKAECDMCMRAKCMTERQKQNVDIGSKKKKKPELKVKKNYSNVFKRDILNKECTEVCDNILHKHKRNKEALKNMWHYGYRQMY